MRHGIKIIHHLSSLIITFCQHTHTPSIPIDFLSIHEALSHLFASA